MRYEFYDIKPRLSRGIEVYKSGEDLMDALDVCVKDTYDMYSARPVDEDGIWSGFDVMSDVSDSCGKIQKRISEDREYRAAVYRYILGEFLESVDGVNDLSSVIGIV